MGKKLFIPFVAVLSLITIVILKGGFIFLLLALLPSVVAWFVDTKDNKALFKTVLACNAAATLPTLVHMIDVAINPPDYIVPSPMSQPQVWMTVYLGAAAGWSLIFFCRYAARIIITIVYKIRITSMENMQKKLAEEWGQDVTGKNE